MGEPPRRSVLLAGPALRLGIGGGLSSSKGFDVSAFVGTVFATSHKDVGGPGWAIGGAKDWSKKFGKGVNTRFKGISADIDILMNGTLSQPIGFVFDLGGIISKKKEARFTGAVEFAYDIPIYNSK
ncbi:MAG: hypothetical protein IIB67_06060 [Proteobacteria bacterium]|nr:hypothetical protein [Pseudomonadota bacterium]